MFAINYEIDTLLHRDAHDDGIQQVIFPQDAEFPGKPRSRHPSRQGESAKPFRRYDSESSCSEDEQEEERSVTVNGADIGDLPAEYVVNGLRGNEVPVIGTYVDRQVMPGFRYRVRKLGTEAFLFQGKAMALVSIGMGYGKRLTFEGETFNHNSNYFYSDTHPAGYGFSLVAVQPRDLFVVNDDTRAVAEARLENVLAQKELSFEVEEDGSLVKKVAVTFTCSIDYSGDKHGLMPLYASERLRLSGLALIVRGKRARKAYTKFIKQVELSRFGTCTLEA